MMSEKTTPVADSGVPEERWTNVHPLTPVINSWKLIAALVGFILWQNPEIIGHLRDPEVSEVFQRDGVYLYVSLSIVGIVTLLVVLFYLEWRKTAYALGDEAIWFRQGILMRQQRHARYDRIQAVDIVHPLLGRLFGLGKLHIEVAGGADSNVEIAYLPTALLDELRQQVAALAARSHTPHDFVCNEAAGQPQAEGTDFEQGTEGRLVVPTMQVEERPLYVVPTGIHLKSLLRSGAVIGAVFVLLGVAALVIIPGMILGEWVFLGGLFGFAPIILGAGGFIWAAFSSNFAFRAYITPEGIRIQRGLVDTRSQTIPPKRVHAVEVSQSLLWRGPDWYCVRILQAGYVGKDEKSDSNILLPVGTRQEAELAMWLVQPDLGVKDPLALINAGLVGSREIPDPYFVCIPESARKIDWFSWKRRAFALTDTALILRDGWLRRRVTILPVERLQTLAIHQGPLQRALGVASLHMQMVPGQLITIASHVDETHIDQLLSELLRLAQMRRRREAEDTWRQRIASDLTAYEAPAGQVAPELPAVQAVPTSNAGIHTEGTSTQGGPV